MWVIPLCSPPTTSTRARIRNGGQKSAPERPTLTVDQVFELAGRVPNRFRAMVLVTTFASLRDHLEHYVDPDPEGLVFTGTLGAVIGAATSTS
ncbi:hypothetical protein ACXR2U_06330 [Jatrophihabitans sp. YIM 134969]